MSESKTVTTAEVQAILNISRQTVMRLIERGELHPLPVNPVLRKARRHLFDRSEVERFKREHS